MKEITIDILNYIKVSIHPKINIIHLEKENINEILTKIILPKLNRNKKSYINIIIDPLVTAYHKEFTSTFNSKEDISLELQENIIKNILKTYMKKMYDSIHETATLYEKSRITVTSNNNPELLEMIPYPTLKELQENKPTTEISTPTKNKINKEHINNPNIFIFPQEYTKYTNQIPLFLTQQETIEFSINHIIPYYEQHKKLKEFIIDCRNSNIIDKNTIKTIKKILIEHGYQTKVDKTNFINI